MSKSRFLTQFIQRGKTVGSVTPSSRFLARKIIEHIPFERMDVLVELGPGTGAFTPFLLHKMKPDARLFLVELNEVFYQELVEKIQDPRVCIIHGSATDLCQMIHDQGLSEVDGIVSSLPLSILSSSLRKEILEASQKALKNKGIFVQFQYSLQSRKKILNLYGNMKLGFTLWNFPPAFVYTCTK